MYRSFWWPLPACYTGRLLATDRLLPSASVAQRIPQIFVPRTAHPVQGIQHVVLPLIGYLLEKLIVAQLVKISSVFMEHRGSYFQQQATDRSLLPSYLSHLNPHILFQIGFTVVPPSTLRSPKLSLTFISSY